MKNYFVIISIMIIFLVPLNASAGIDESPERDSIEISNQSAWAVMSPNPYISAYLVQHNEHGELVGAIHFDTILSKDNPVFSSAFNIPLSENLVTKEICNPSLSTCVPTQYLVSLPIQTKFYVDADCNNADQESLGYGNIYDTCLFYVFTTIHTVSMTHPETGERLRIDLWDSLHHGYVAEAGDTVTTDWTILIPRN